ncbi:MAG: hypothetical protein CMK07_04900 [Ponticaulis sp.]|nr:hypothetical protein [Ponticaulis sp.]
MTDTSSTDNYEPTHSWYRDEHDDPNHANWLWEFSDPTGKTRKPVFLRGQVLLWLVRIFAYFIVVSVLLSGTFFPLFLIAPGLKVIEPQVEMGAIVFFGVFGLATIASLISHIRRLNDSRRSPFWAVFVPLPIIAAGVSFALTVSQPMPEFVGGGTPPPVASASPETEDASAANAEGEEVATEAQTSSPPRRLGPPVKMTWDNYVSGAVGGSFWIWLIAGFVVALFSFLFVARGRSDIDKLDSF